MTLYKQNLLVYNTKNMNYKILRNEKLKFIKLKKFGTLKAINKKIKT